MVSYYRVIYLAFVAFHLLISAGHNVLALSDAVSVVYGRQLLSNHQAQALRGVLRSAPLVHHGSVTGVGMSYGFYAPSVGHPYVAAVESLAGNDGETVFHAGLRTPIGIMRFSSALEIYQWMGWNGDDSTITHLTGQIAEQLAKRFENQTLAEETQCKIYRIDPPRLRRPERGIRLQQVYPRH